MNDACLAPTRSAACCGCATGRNPRSTGRQPTAHYLSNPTAIWPREARGPSLSYRAWSSCRFPYVPSPPARIGPGGSRCCKPERCRSDSALCGRLLGPKCRSPPRSGQRDSRPGVAAALELGPTWSIGRNRRRAWGCYRQFSPDFQAPIASGSGSPGPFAGNLPRAREGRSRLRSISLEVELEVQRCRELGDAEPHGDGVRDRAALAGDRERGVRHASRVPRGDREGRAPGRRGGRRR